MSAWVCDREHFDVLVCAALHASSRLSWWQVDENGGYAGWRYLDEMAETRESDEYVTPSMLGDMLVRENVRSVSYRYPNDDVEAGELPGPIDAYYLGPYVYRSPSFIPTPGQVFKAIDCIDYQSCEHPEWRTSEACAFLRVLREAYCARVDGYEEAPWGFDSSTVTHSDIRRVI